MSQHDMSIANQGFPAFRADLNDALPALASNNSGATEPSTMFAHQWWVDTSANPSVLKQRNADNDAWITIANIDQTGDKFILVNPEYTGTLTGGTGVVNFGSGQFYKDDSGNVGIGTSSPAYKLDINVASATFRVRDGSGGNDFVIKTITGPVSIVGSEENTPIAFMTNNTERMRIDSTGVLKFNSGYGSVATAYGCRAWVNFNGTGAVAIRASGNVSSITDNGTGSYNANFTTAMPDANYSVSAVSRNAGLQASFTSASASTASSVFAGTHDTAGSVLDVNQVFIQVFR
jgi:hypothetical protein